MARLGSSLPTLHACFPKEAGSLLIFFNCSVSDIRLSFPVLEFREQAIGMAWITTADTWFPRGYQHRRGGEVRWSNYQVARGQCFLQVHRLTCHKPIHIMFHRKAPFLLLPNGEDYMAFTLHWSIQ